MASSRKKRVPDTEPLLVPSRSGVADPLVFISHDSRDADLAEAFANLLTDASGGILRSFRSSDRKGTAGIEFGAEWYTAIMQKLGDATDVVALLTTRSINRPWILYETGVAKGKLESPVFGLALGIPLDESATGPFAQFQNSADDEDSITKLVLQLIKRNPQASPREEAVMRQVQAFREQVAKILKDRKPESAKAQSKVDETSVAKLFEEVKVLVRDMPDRVAVQVVGRPGSRKRRRRFRPYVFKELFHNPALRENQDGLSTGLLVMASFYRDDIPWLYDLIRDVAFAVAKRSAPSIRMATERLERAAYMLYESRMMREIFDDIDDEELYHFTRETVREIVHMVQDFYQTLKSEPKSSAKAIDDKG